MNDNNNHNNTDNNNNSSSINDNNNNTNNNDTTTNNKKNNNKKNNNNNDNNVHDNKLTITNYTITLRNTTEDFKQNHVAVEPAFPFCIREALNNGLFYSPKSVWVCQKL